MEETEERKKRKEKIKNVVIKGMLYNNKNDTGLVVEELVKSQIDANEIEDA